QLKIRPTKSETEQGEDGEKKGIEGTAGDREVSVTLKVEGKNATRVQVVAKRTAVTGTRTSPALCSTRSSPTRTKEPMPPIVWIDGTYHDRTNAKVSVFDHGLLYGDGVFEGIRVYNRRVFRLAQHLDRLYASAKGIWLEIPLAKPAMHRLVEEAVAKSGLEEAC